MYTVGFPTIVDLNLYVKSLASSSALTASRTFYSNSSSLLKRFLRASSIFASMLSTRLCCISSIFASRLGSRFYVRPIRVLFAMAFLFKPSMSSLIGPIMWFLIAVVFSFYFSSSVCPLTKSSNSPGSRRSSRWALIA